MAWAAKMERLAINERIAAARRRVEAEGGRWGRPRSMDDRQVKRAAALRRQGLSVRQVSSRMRVPKSTVERALKA
jgi:DNA invertase Pin-like site-specific DNA recombinase